MGQQVAWLFDSLMMISRIETSFVKIQKLQA